MIKENLSMEERIALGNLVELCRDVALLVNNDYDETTLVTNFETLDFQVFDKKDWASCLKALEE